MSWGSATSMVVSSSLFIVLIRAPPGISVAVQSTTRRVVRIRSPPQSRSPWFLSRPDPHVNASAAHPPRRTGPPPARLTPPRLCSAPPVQHPNAADQAPHAHIGPSQCTHPLDPSSSSMLGFGQRSQKRKIETNRYGGTVRYMGFGGRVKGS
jgi:hypothetical protein